MTENSWGLPENLMPLSMSAKYYAPPKPLKPILSTQFRHWEKVLETKITLADLKGACISDTFSVRQYMQQKTMAMLSWYRTNCANQFNNKNLHTREIPPLFVKHKIPWFEPKHPWAEFCSMNGGSCPPPPFSSMPFHKKLLMMIGGHSRTEQDTTQLGIARGYICDQATFHPQTTFSHLIL